MATQSDLIAWRDRLVIALASDVREVTDSDGSRISYRSTSEVRAALDYVNALLLPPVTAVRFTTHKGL